MSVLSCCTGPRCRATGGLPLLRGFHYDNACLRGGREPLLLKKLACRVPPLPLAERLPDEIKYNPTETKLICLWFFFILFFFLLYTEPLFSPPLTRSHHVTPEFEHSKDPMTGSIILRSHFPLAFWITICFLCSLLVIRY